ncbi:MAG: EcsC family protein [Sarcina sp.]
MKKEVLTQSKLMKVMDWSYKKAVDGLPGMDTADELAQNYLKKSKSADEAIDKLITWQQTKGATSGFLTGIGGIVTLSVAIPTNITSVLYIQIRMIAAIASMKGYDLRDDQVKIMVFVALTGQGATEILKKSGMKIGQGMATTLVHKIPTEVIKAINQKVGFRLLTKFGEKGVVNLGKMIPLVGGVIGGGFDAVGTRIIGKTAKKLFS